MSEEACISSYGESPTGIVSLRFVADFLWIGPSLPHHLVRRHSTREIPDEPFGVSHVRTKTRSGAKLDSSGVHCRLNRASVTV